MKKFLFLAFGLCFFYSTAQENLSLKTKYKVGNCYVIDGYDDIDDLEILSKKFGANYILKEEIVKEVIHKKGDSVNSQKEILINGEKNYINDNNIILDSNIIVKVKKGVICEECPIKPKKAFVKLKDDKLYVNYFLNNDGLDNEATYYFKLKNRETITIFHSGWQISALTIPLKYRFATERKGVDLNEEFSASLNLNLMLSWTFIGHTKFTYLKNVDNSIRDHSWSLGFFIGAAPLSLDKSNTTSAGMERLGDGIELKKGLFSTGLGVNYRYNTVGVGVFLGYDYALGSKSKIWDYDSKPWLGFSLGIDVLKLGKAAE
jgi:hypothetical protein